MNKWISVKDRLPDEEENVLVWKKGYSQMGAFRVSDRRGLENFYLINDWGWGERDIVLKLDGVTHWMPLPETPNE